MYETNIGGPPTPPFRHLRGGNHKKKGCLSFFTRIPLDAKIKIAFMTLGMLAGFGLVIWWLWPKGDPQAEAKEETPVVVQTVAPLSTLPPAPVEEITATPIDVASPSPLEPAQIAATATAHYLYSRPAQINPEASPYLVGVVTYEPGCMVSNLGFTTAGLEGTPYYLYFNHPMDRDPLMQMIQVRGYIQRFDGCQYPVLMVSEVFWMSDTGTPAPIAASYLPITNTITGTVAATPPPWGSLPTPNKYHTPIYNPAGWTPTPYPTYTPFPSATAYVPPAPSTRIVYITRNDPDPTNTPTRTPTHTPTPVTVSIYGDIVTIVGCPYTNLAVSDGQQTYFIELAGATLPAGDPAAYWGMVSGRAARICDAPSIKASQIIWYDPPTPTATSTPTETPIPTDTPTATVTHTPTLTATEVITP